MRTPSTNLPPDAIEGFLRRGFSRRALARISALATAGAALPFYNEPALAQLSNIGRLPPGAVKLNANENPQGPCPQALEALTAAARNGGRYLYEETFDFARVLAEQEGVQPNCVMPAPGSSQPLHWAVLAFTSPTRPLVMAEPGYEAGKRAAKFIGSDVVGVPLTSSYAHDVRAMAKAAPNGGLFYICNPNNPTGTTTPRADIEWLVANKPEGSVVLVDEAYLHFCEEPACTDLVAKGKDVVILRTFSKLYGMAGLRAGAAIARPDLLAKMQAYGAGAMPVTGMVAALASLKTPGLVEERRKFFRQIREDIFAWMEKKGYSFVPSVSNKFMVDVKRPGQEVIKEMAARNVYIGRVWPAWPTHVRVSIGTPEEMAAFRRAFEQVMG